MTMTHRSQQQLPARASIQVDSAVEA